MPRDAIRIEELEVSCVVGVYPEERQREQRLVVSVELGLDLERAGLSGELAATCDYARVADELTALLRFRRYRLLETAAEELTGMLVAVHPQVERVRLRLDKPEALQQRARAAGVTVGRKRGDFPRCSASAEHGTAEIVLVTTEAELALLRVEPGRTARPAGLAWVVAGYMNSGTCWIEHGQKYMNEGTSTATLFCCRMRTGGGADAV